MHPLTYHAHFADFQWPSCVDQAFQTACTVSPRLATLTAVLGATYVAAFRLTNASHMQATSCTSMHWFKYVSLSYGTLSFHRTWQPEIQHAIGTTPLSRCSISYTQLFVPDMGAAIPEEVDECFSCKHIQRHCRTTSNVNGTYAYDHEIGL